MAISATEVLVPRATGLSVTDDALSVDLDDGRTVVVPLGWFPRLAQAHASERENWRLIGGGRGIHWPDIEEDLSVESLIAGRRSAEAPASFKAWLGARGSK